jgi:hypothetical protein
MRSVVLAAMEKHATAAGVPPDSNRFTHHAKARRACRGRHASAHSWGWLEHADVSFRVLAGRSFWSSRTGFPVAFY